MIAQITFNYAYCCNSSNYSALVIGGGGNLLALNGLSDNLILVNTLRRLHGLWSARSLCSCIG